MTLQVGKKSDLFFMREGLGFTLIEVMVSVAILSIGLVLILNSFMKSIRAIELSEDYFKAGLLSQTKIFEIYNTDIEEGLSDGEFTEFGNRFSWDLDVVNMEEDSINEISLDVSWNQGKKRHNLSLFSYKL